MIISNASITGFIFVRWNMYQRTFLLMIYVEKTSYFETAPPGRTIAYKIDDNLSTNDTYIS